MSAKNAAYFAVVEVKAFQWKDKCCDWCGKQKSKNWFHSGSNYNQHFFGTLCWACWKKFCEIGLPMAVLPRFRTLLLTRIR